MTCLFLRKVFIVSDNYSGDNLLYVLNKETISELRSDKLGKKYLLATYSNNL